MSAPENSTGSRVAYVDRTPTELIVLKSGATPYDGCDKCCVCLSLLKMFLGNKPSTQLYSACDICPMTSNIVDNALRFVLPRCWRSWGTMLV